MKADRSLDGRMIVIAQSWQMNMRAIFSCTHLAQCHGHWLHRNVSPEKSAHHLQKGAALAEYIPDKSVIVIDGMSLVKKVGQNDGTFGEIAAVIHSMVFKEGSHSSRIDIVFDTYRDMSIENVERTLRGNDQGLHLQNISETKLAKQWKKFLRQSCNKASLIQFLLNVWKKYKYTDKLVGKCLYVTNLDKCWKITHNVKSFQPRQSSIWSTVEPPSKFACEDGGGFMRVVCHKTGHNQH